LGGQVPRLYGSAVVGQNEGVMQRGLKLPDIAGPWCVRQRATGMLGQSGDAGVPELSGKASEQEFGERANVGSALQRW
jgi:hypothetical protein